MKHLIIQLQPERELSLNEKDAIKLIECIGLTPRIYTGNDNGKYINLDFSSNDVKKLWSQINRELLGNPKIGIWIRNVSIITCEGKNGWDDYLLLSHYDRNERLDSF